jgi:hypothetical protein
MNSILLTASSLTAGLLAGTIFGVAMCIYMGEKKIVTITKKEIKEDKEVELKPKQHPLEAVYEQVLKE